MPLWWRTAQSRRSDLGSKEGSHPWPQCPLSVLPRQKEPWELTTWHAWGAGARAKHRQLPLPTLGRVTPPHLLGPCIITQLLNRDELTKLPSSFWLSRAVPTQKPEPTRELWPIMDIYCPIN